MMTTMSFVQMSHYLELVQHAPPIHLYIRRIHNLHKYYYLPNKMKTNTVASLKKIPFRWKPHLLFFDSFSLVWS